MAWPLWKTVIISLKFTYGRLFNKKEPLIHTCVDTCSDSDVSLETE